MPASKAAHGQATPVPAAGPGRARRGRASWARTGTPHHPPPPPLAKRGFWGAGPAQAEPVLAPKGKGHGAKCPQAAGRPGLLHSSFLLSRLYMAATGLQSARRAWQPSRGPSPHARLHSFLGQAWARPIPWPAGDTGLRPRPRSLVTLLARKGQCTVRGNPQSGSS